MTLHKIISTSVIVSLITSIMLGGLGIDILGSIYYFLFNRELPEYLDYGFNAIAMFSLYYPLFLLLVVLPLTCLTHFHEIERIVTAPSKEDIIYIIAIYIVYLYVVWQNGLLTPKSAVAGIFAVFLPFLYRFVVYSVDTLMKKYHEKCMYPLALFVVSFILSIAVTIVYFLVFGFVLTVVTV